jgi:RNA polymerase sigma factor (sigma-70 family)
MPTSPTTSVIEHLRKALLPDGPEPDDGELLGCFIERRDEAALAALVKRHGPMVWGVCRRLLSHHDAEDAFQATFLVLVRKAGSVRPRAMVGNWLYGVAHQTALQARRAAARRKAKEVQVTQMPDTAAVQPDRWLDLQPVLDQELSGLPSYYRAVIVLCDLEGRTRTEVARQLGVPEGTVAGRLARARALLAKRLTRRGITVSGGALAAVLAQTVASAGVPTTVLSSTIHVATLFAAGKATGVLSVPVARLAEGVLKAMLLKKILTTTVAALALGLAAVLAGDLAVGQVVGRPASIEKPMGEKKPPERPIAPGPGVAKPRTDLPKGAIARLGSASFRHPGEVHRLAFTTDNRQLSAIGPSGVSRWTVQEGQVALTAMGRAKGYRHLSVIAPNGKAAVELLNREEDAPDGTLYSVHVTDLTTGRALGKFPATREKPQPGPYSLHGAISPDGSILALQYCAEVSLYSLPGGKLLRRLTDEDRVFRHVAFAPDGKQVVVGSLDQLSLTVWEVVTGNIRKTLRAEGRGTGDLSLSPDGKLIVAACNRQERVKLADGGTRSKDHAGTAVAVWDLASGKLLRCITSDLPVRSLHVLPDGTVIGVVKPADTFARSALRKWRLSDGKLLWSASAGFRIPVAALSHDGSLLATASPEGIVRLWETATGKVRPLEGHATSIGNIAFSADGKTVRTTDGIDVRTWDANSGRLKGRLAPAELLRSAQWVSGGRIIAGISRARDSRPAIAVFDAVAGKKLLGVAGSERETGVGAFGFALSADGTRLALPVMKNKRLHMQLWDVRTAKMAWEMAMPADWSSRNVVITADGRVLAGCTDLIALDVATGKHLARWDLVKSDVLPVDESNNTHLYPSRDGRTLGFVIQNVGILLVDSRTGKLARRIDTKGEVHWPLSFSADGSRFATSNAFGDTGIRIWETATGKLLGRLEGSPSHVLAIDFSPDGRRLASGGEEGAALVWNIAGMK